MTSGGLSPRGGRRAILMGDRFFRQAEYDLEVARGLVGPHQFYVAAYLAHQASEKALKGVVWVLTGHEPPWKHSLRQLAELAVSVPAQIPAQVAVAIAVLTPIFEQTRYPSGDITDPIPADLIEDSVARDAILAAEEVMAWVGPIMGRSSTRG